MIISGIIWAGLFLLLKSLPIEMIQRSEVAVKFKEADCGLLYDWPWERNNNGSRNDSHILVDDLSYVQSTLVGNLIRSLSALLEWVYMICLGLFIAFCSSFE